MMSEKYRDSFYLHVSFEVTVKESEGKQMFVVFLYWELFSVVALVVGRELSICCIKNAVLNELKFITF